MPHFKPYDPPPYVRAAAVYVVKLAGPISRTELTELFCPDGAVDGFHTGLIRLVKRGELAHSRSPGLKHLGPGPAFAPPGFDWAAERRRKPDAPVWVGPIVPPRRVDFMGGPVLTFGAVPPARPGADDHKRWQSVGVRC